jgi:Core-2/I-Branching enzyme
MKVAHILLVHKNPQQIIRLVKRLAHPDVDCWIHIDKKFDTDNFRNVLSKENVFFIENNIKVDWGCYNTLEAMLLSIRNVLSTNKDYDYINFLSGQDYVLYPPVTFLKYLKANKGKEFIGIQPYKATNQNIIRIEKYHLNGYSFAGKDFVQRVINKILPNRKFPYHFEIRKGPQWFTISREAAKYALDFTEKNTKFVRYFKLVDTPDEFFFQTILYNSDFRLNIFDVVFHYTDWSQNKRNPKLLTLEDKDNILSSPYFFARKFDMEIDSDILDMLDKERLPVLIQ